MLIMHSTQFCYSYAHKKEKALFIRKVYLPSVIFNLNVVKIGVFRKCKIILPTEINLFV